MAPYPGQPHKNCSTLMDLTFLLDASGSVPLAAWSHMLRFSATVGVNFTSGDTRVATSLGVIQFSSSVTTFIPFTASNATFLQTLNMMPKISGGTDTAAGMLEVQRVFNTYGRPGSFRVMIILTDGMWNGWSDPVRTSQEMQANGTAVFAVAIGNAAGSNVKALASSPQSKFYYEVSSEADLPNILTSIVNHICDRSS